MFLVLKPEKKKKTKKKQRKIRIKVNAEIFKINTTGYTFLGIADQASNIKSTYRRLVTSKIRFSSSDNDLRHTIHNFPPSLWAPKDCRMSGKPAIFVREIANVELATSLLTVFLFWRG